MFYKIAHIENGEKVVINVEAASLNSYVFFLCIKNKKNYVDYVFLQSHFDAVALEF